MIYPVFSESAILVERLFGRIFEMAADEEAFIVVLIDEVESIASSRSTMNGNEPTDALRVVNSILTNIDRIAMFKNVLVLCTSNLAENMGLLQLI